jgi:hypothetical protein
MTAPVSDRAPVIDVRRIRELGEWEALDAYRAECAAASVEELTGRGSAAFYLRQVALEAVIAERMRVRGTISIHRALLAGASVPEIADVMDASCEQIAERWRSWADGQRHLRQRFPLLGIGQPEYDRAAAVVGSAGGRPSASADSLPRCACPPGKRK